MMLRLAQAVLIAMVTVLTYQIYQRSTVHKPFWLGLLSMLILSVSWWVQTRRNFWAMVPNVSAAYLYFSFRWIIMAFAIFILLGKGYLQWWELLFSYTFMLLISVISIKNE